MNKRKNKLNTEKTNGSLYIYIYVNEWQYLVPVALCMPGIKLKLGFNPYLYHILMFQRFVPEIRCPCVTALLSSDGMIFPPSVLRPPSPDSYRYWTATSSHKSTVPTNLRTHLYIYWEREREWRPRVKWHIYQSTRHYHHQQQQTIMMRMMRNVVAITQKRNPKRCPEVSETTREPRTVGWMIVLTMIVLISI